MMIGIIKTVENHHLVMKETTKILIIKEADMKVQGELLVQLMFNWTLKVESLQEYISKQPFLQLVAILVETRLKLKEDIKWKLMNLNVKKSVAVIQTCMRWDIDMNGIM